MKSTDRRSEWTVLVGIALVGLGAWLLVGRFFGWVLAPLTVAFELIARVGWPLLLIAIGILLVLRARGGGWNPAGGRIFRSRNERLITGVLGGLAQWMGVNPLPVRVFYVFFTMFTGWWLGIMLYVLATIFLAEESYQTIIDGTPVGYTAPVTPAAAPPVPAPPTSAASQAAAPFVTREAPTPPPVAPPAPAPAPAAAPPVPPVAPQPPAPEPPAAPAPEPAPEATPEPEQSSAPEPDSGFEPPADPEAPAS